MAALLFVLCLMRLDKFLKVSRIIKRRQVANDACSSGRVSLNGKIAKAGAVVSVGDLIEVQFGTRNFKIKVLKLDEKVNKADSSDLYEII